jgi:hypothetical protein
MNSLYIIENAYEKQIHSPIVRRRASRFNEPGLKGKSGRI